MAARGAKVAVVTIDPAKRLANALGLQELHNEPRLVGAERLAGAGLEIQGELWAMMLDPKRTFDELIERVAPDPDRAEEIKANRVYRELSTAVSGSQEFTAIAKLYELDQEHRHDLLGDSEPSDVAGALSRVLAGDLAERVAENLHDYHVLARRDELNLRRLRKAFGKRAPLLVIPQLDSDVHDVEGLLRLHAYLFASAEERERLIAEVVA